MDTWCRVRTECLQEHAPVAIYMHSASCAMDDAVEALFVCTRLQMPLLAVGAAFPFHAGQLPQAPTRLQGWGLEWLFRLVQEPRRLWRRYLLLNPLYLLLLLLQATRLYRLDPAAGPAPLEALRYG